MGNPSNRVVKPFAFFSCFLIILIAATYLCFRLILNYYAPRGQSTDIPISQLQQPLELVTTAEVWRQTEVAQPFIAQNNGLGKIHLQVGSWPMPPSDRKIDWKLIEVINSTEQQLKRSGVLNNGSAKQGEFIDLEFKPIQDSACKQYLLTFSTPYTPRSESIKFPVFKLQNSQFQNAFVNYNLKDTPQTRVDLAGAFKGSLSYFHQYSQPKAQNQ